MTTAKPKRDAAAWQQANRDIIEAVDLPREYAAMGLDIQGQANASGWVSCRCWGRDDRSPSAGVNLSGDHPTLGRYKEFSGECRSLSFWEFCALSGRFVDWKAAQQHFAKETGVELPAPPRHPDSQLAWRPYAAGIVSQWCQDKGGVITEPAARACGARMAGYPRKTSNQSMIALPVFGPLLLDDDPTNYVMFRTSAAAKVKMWQGPKVGGYKEIKYCPMPGMPPGWVGRWGLAHLADAEIVWKVEGISDLLTLQSVIPRDKIRSHVVITNSHGAGNVLPQSHLAALEGKQVLVCHDADTPGQKGAEAWVSGLLEAGVLATNVVLPFPIKPDHGEDLRDFFS